MPKICSQRKLRNMAKNNKEIEGKLKYISDFPLFFHKKILFLQQINKTIWKRISD
jgi:hypothetical protein